MSRVTRTLVLALSVGGPWRLAPAQDSSVVAFLAVARAATGKYQRLEIAIADGYRAMGPETPGMGQHWVKPALVLRGRVPPPAPQILEYATVNGAPRLVGVAFAIPLSGAEMPPDLPVPGSWWHAHSGGLDEEAVGLDHAGMGEMKGERVAVLHAWIWTPNPMGTFEVQNWSLPFIRLGLTPPAEAQPDAANALALSIDPAFYLAHFRILIRPDPGEQEALARLLGDESDSVKRLLAERRGPDLDRLALERLAGRWRALSAALAARSGPGRYLLDRTREDRDVRPRDPNRERTTPA